MKVARRKVKDSFLYLFCTEYYERVSRLRFIHYFGSYIHFVRTHLENTSCLLYCKKKFERKDEIKKNGFVKSTYFFLNNLKITLP